MSKQIRSTVDKVSNDRPYA